MRPHSIYVIGAGVVGISCAINLRRRGCDVRLIDRKEPAEETSYGNSGVICNSYLLPQAKPSLLAKLPRMLFNRDPRFLIHYPHLALLSPWLSRFASNCNSRTMQRRVPPLSHLLSNAIEEHVELMVQSGAGHYLNDNGWLRLYSSQTSFDHTRIERLLYERYKVSHESLTWPRIRELEPDLTRQYEHGTWLDRLPSVTNPGALAKKYAQHFRDLGGTIVRAEVDHLSRTDEGWIVRSNEKDYDTGQVVVALGAWSSRLLGIDGPNNPIAIERGYHMMFEPRQGKELRRCIIDVDRGFVMTPMATGIRVTTATNLVASETAPDYTQINELFPSIHATFPLGEPLLSQPWMGRRPSTADSLPIIGPSANHPGLWYAFGHGHLGFTLGPVTGKIIGSAIAGDPWDPMNDPFLPSRFSLKESVS